MTETPPRQLPRPIAAVLAAAAIGVFLGVGAGCASKGGKKPDAITQELLTSPKEQLFEKGKALIDKKKYDQARKYLNHVFENYPNDQIGREALLLVADSYFRQKTTSSYTEARYRYRDYLNRYPGAPRRDYARYQYALCSDKEHQSPDRDKTSTKEAIDQYNALIREFPDSGFAGAARERVRQLIDLLAEHDFGIGYFYLRKGSAASALGRFTQLEQRYPNYNAKDKLYYYQAVALARLGRTDEARQYFGKVLEEYPSSEFAKKSKSKMPKASPPPEKPATATISVDTKPQTQ